MLALLALLAGFLPLSRFVAGWVPGGGRRPDERPAPPPGERVISVLRAADRTPVAGARILLRDLEGRRTEMTADESGRVRLPGTGPLLVQATSAGERGEAWVTGDTVLEITPAKRRSGRVRTPEGAAVAHAAVRLLSAEGEVLASTESGPDGRYEVLEDPRAVAVCAAADGGAPASALEGDLVLGPGRPIRARILGAHPGPIEIFGEFAPADTDRLLPFRSSATTGSDGSFETHVPRGARAFGVVDSIPFVLRDGEIDLPPRETLRGKVRPPCAATLLFRSTTSGDFPAPIPPVTVSCDARGEFSVVLARSPWQVEVRAEGFAALLVEDVVPGARPLLIDLKPGFALEGSVADSEGRAVAGAQVLAHGLPAGVLRRGYSDGTGRFRLTGLSGETARIRVLAAGFAPWQRDEVPPGAGLAITLSR